MRKFYTLVLFLLVTVSSLSQIVANDDLVQNINGMSGSTNSSNVLINNGSGADTLNGFPISISLVTISILTTATPSGSGFPVPSVNPSSGVVSIPAGTPASNYTITYQICETANPNNCDTAIVTIGVNASLLDAVNDLFNVNNTISSNIGNVLNFNGFGNDQFNGAPVFMSQINMTTVFPAIPLFPGALVPILNNSTGNLSIVAGTPAGTYTITYQICEILNPTNCDTAVITINVVNSTTSSGIDAVNDNFNSIFSTPNQISI